MKHLDYLDGWRGLAIGMVLIQHFFGTPGFDSGRYGVELFFVLSGLLMSRILFEQHTPLILFYKRRVSRILPVFLLFCLSMFVMSRLANLPWSATEIETSLVFLRTYYTHVAIWHTAVPAGHLWSLNVEEHCYLVLALVAAIPFARRHEGWFVAGLAGISAAFIIWYFKNPEYQPDEYYLLRTECAAFGLLASASYAQIKRHFASLFHPWMMIGAFVLGAACYERGLPSWTEMLAAPLLLAFAVNHLDETYAWTRRAFSVKALCKLGVWSYSIYLWQQPFFKFKTSLPPGVALLCAFVVGLTSYYLFERPVRDWINRNWAAARNEVTLSRPTATSP